MFLGFLKICAMAAAIWIIKYRERIGEFVGDAYWMRYVGGVYNLIFIFGVFIFFWAIASLTGTTKILFFPFYILLGGMFA